MHITLFQWFVLSLGALYLLAFIVNRIFIRPQRNKQEERRVTKMNQSIAHDQKMNNFVQQNRNAWEDPDIQAKYLQMKQTESQLRQDLNDLGGHTSVN